MQPAAPTASSTSGWLQTLKWKIMTLLLTTLIMVAIEIPAASNARTMAELARVMAIYPRHVGIPGLPGIPLHPWLHYGWSHLSANLAGWWLLGGCMLLADGLVLFWATFWFVCLVGGSCVWAAAFRSNSLHAGLSGVLFGFFGFLLFRVWWERPINWKSVISLLIAFIIYGISMLTSFFKFNKRVSWEGHFYGFLAGILFAFLYFKVGMKCLKRKDTTQGTTTSTQYFAPPEPAQTTAQPQSTQPQTNSSAFSGAYGWGSPQFSQPMYAYNQGNNSSNNTKPGGNPFASSAYV